MKKIRGIVCSCVWCMILYKERTEKEAYGEKAMDSWDWLSLDRWIILEFHRRAPFLGSVYVLRCSSLETHCDEEGGSETETRRQGK